MLKEKNKEFESLFNKNKNEINEQKTQTPINNFELKISENGIINNLDSVIIKENILYNKNLKNWISPNKKIKADLLFRLTKDGNLASDFHKKCDNKSQTLTLFNLVDGNIFGMYTPLSWENNCGWKFDMESFIFILNKNIKYKKIKKDFSIYCNITSGPCAGNIACEGPKLDSLYNRNIDMFYNCYENDKEIPLSKSDIKLIDIEVFEIIYY